MNPQKLYALTYMQQQQYQIQPDYDTEPEARIITDEYELPNFVSQTAFRFWYNTQTESYPLHWHDAQEIIIPLQDSYTVTLRDRDYCIEPGDIFLIPPGELHSIPDPPPGSRFIFLIGLAALTKLCHFADTRALLADPIHISAATHPDIYEHEISLIMQMASHYWSNSLTKEMHIYACLLDFYSCYTDFCISGTSAPSQFVEARTQQKRTTEKLNTAVNYMTQHFAEDITLESVAEIVGLSKYYFTRAFKRHTGQTFCEHLNYLRIEAAEKLLLDSGLSISSICKNCGYSCISSFNRAFRRHKGYTPSEYRNNHSS